MLVKEQLRLRLQIALASDGGGDGDSDGGGSIGGGGGSGAPDELLRRCCGLGLRACAAEHALYAAFFAVGGAAGVRSAGMLAAQVPGSILTIAAWLEGILATCVSLGVRACPAARSSARLAPLGTNLQLWECGSAGMLPTRRAHPAPSHHTHHSHHTCL